jgi:homoserine kinase
MTSGAWRDGTVTVRVPATSANLGPGFDSFGLALAMYDEVSVRVVDEGLRVEIVGEGQHTLARDESHLVVRSIRAGFAAVDLPQPGLEISCVNRIPHGRGLGSSSAAIVAGVVAARALASDGSCRMADADLLVLADRLEGHPDNVAACLYGGFTLAWSAPEGVAAFRLTPDERIRPVVFIPATELATKRARGLLPETVPHVDAAANSARAALLVVALTSQPGLLVDATEDRLHQEYRRPAMPESLALVDRLRAAEVPATVSGAGPTVLALTTDATRQRALSVAPGGWRVEQLEFDLVGAVSG